VKPPLATVIYDALGEPIYRCPYCQNEASMDECDGLGADEGCLFCNCCSGEFEMPGSP
jgi:hypothetical protein